MPSKSAVTGVSIRFAGFDSVHPDDYVFSPPQPLDCYVLLLTNTPARFFHDGVLEAYPAGCAVLYAPRQKIYYTAHNVPFSDNWLYFTSGSPSFASFPGFGRPVRVSDPEYLRRLFQLIAWESVASNSSTEILEHLIRVVYLRLMDDYAAQGQTPMQYALNRLRKEIANSPEYPWTVTHMARLLSVSPGYLQAMYKKEFGVSCIDDVIETRLRKAHEILSYTDDSVAEVAAACGYRNVEHFIRQFRKAYGTSPAAFRRERRASLSESAPAGSAAVFPAGRFAGPRPDRTQPDSGAIPPGRSPSEDNASP